MEGITFSPLTSSEFRELEHKDPSPGFSSLVMRTYDEELSNILDIAGLPTGSGAGYGVGVADDELPALDLRYANYTLKRMHSSKLSQCLSCLVFVAVMAFVRKM